MKISLYIFLFATVSFFSREKPVKGLVADYTFNNNNGKDEAGTNDARIHNALPTFDRFGNAKYAYYLHGNIDSYINLGTSPVLKPKQGSISLWVKINLVTYYGKGLAGNPVIITKSHDGVDFNEAYNIGYNFNLKHLTVATSLSEFHQAYVHTDKTTSLRDWHHVVMTYDNHFLCYYLDGELEGKVTKDFESRFLETDSVLVGICIDKKNVRFLTGCVDDIKIYDRVISRQEALELYRSPNPNRSKVILGWALLFTGAGLLVLLGIFLVRRYIRLSINKEKEKNRLEVQWYEQENKVLKAQMNPHFIFNSLNTIQHFIILNDNKKAQLYLTKFSRLIRLQLESTLTDKISLKEEIELCERYLEMESLRFNNVFKYSITVKNTFGLKTIYIPHSLIQVFIENAIWHGLLPKEGDKELTVTFEVLNEQTLNCHIDDNGVGRKPPKVQEYKKSLAISFIKQRLFLYSKTLPGDYSVTIVDKVDAEGKSEGTQVILNIPILNK